MDVLVGTARGLLRLDGTALLERDITAMARHGDELVVLADGSEVLAGMPGALRPLGTLEGARGRCVLPTPDGVLVGMAGAHLARDLSPLDAFDAAPGRDDWYTPWGGPPDTRSMTLAANGTVFVNVHVGGILRSTDAGATWTPTIDIDTDIHQVLAHDGLVMATGAFALHISEDAGATWREVTDGFAATYMRALAVAGDTVLVTAARSHAGGSVGVYRRALGNDGPFEACAMPERLGTHNIDTHWLDARGEHAAFVTHDGVVFGSTDAGASWELLARGLSEPSCLVLA